VEIKVKSREKEEKNRLEKRRNNNKVHKSKNVSSAAIKLISLTSNLFLFEAEIYLRKKMEAAKKKSYSFLALH
jgi:flagellar biosynthesis protein FlhB